MPALSSSRMRERWLSPGLGLGARVLVLAALACSPPGTATEEDPSAARTVAPEPETPPCRTPAEGGAWARFEGDRCGWELYDEGQGLALRALDVDAPPEVTGAPPPGCREQTCVYHGVLTEQGPLVLAVVPSRDSEMPTDVQLGVVAGGQLVFVDLWDGAGEAVESDFTRLGPAHALAPFVCGERIALLAVERLEAARGVAPPDTLVAREGGLELGAAELATPAPVQREQCRRVELPVP